VASFRELLELDALLPLDEVASSTTLLSVAMASSSELPLVEALPLDAPRRPDEPPPPDPDGVA
jgi:hypothetical protein